MKISNPGIELVTPYEYLVKTAHNYTKFLADNPSELILSSLSCDEIAVEFERFKDVFANENPKLINSVIQDLLYDKKFEDYELVNHADADIDASFGYNIDKEEIVKDGERISLSKLKVTKSKSVTAWLFQLFLYTYFDNKVDLVKKDEKVVKKYPTTNRLVMLYTFLLCHSERSTSHTINIATLVFNSYRKISMNGLGNIYINPNMNISGSSDRLPSLPKDSYIPAMCDKFEALDGVGISLDNYKIGFTNREVIDRCVELIDLDIQKILIFDKKIAEEALNQYYVLTKSILFCHKEDIHALAEKFRMDKHTGDSENINEGIEKMAETLDKYIIKYKSLRLKEVVSNLKKSDDLKNCYVTLIADHLSFTDEEISRINKIYDNSDVLERLKNFNEAVKFCEKK